jgi:hypothetical protein
MSIEGISTGIRELDTLIDNCHVGDNVICEVVAG